MADEIQTKNITTVDTITSIDNTDKVFVNDNGSFKQISVSNLMKQAPSGITEETDPTVSEWAKQPTKPSYTANEVGALPVGTKIPAKTSDLTNDSGYLTQIPEEYVTETELGQKGYITEDDIPEKLPSPGTLTFTGAVNDTYDGSADKTINIPTGGGEGGTSDYNALANKPKLNGVEIVGNKTSADYKIVSSEQGAENNGKLLGIGVDGNVAPVDKPTYTANEVGARPNTWIPSAEDVGALPNDTEIPSKTSDLENDSGFVTNSDIPEKLPNPQKIIFTGAVSAEYDGSSQQTINIPTGGGESGGGITKKQITALDELFKIVAYTTNPESQYKSFCEAFGIEPVIPPEGKYTVTNNLTNVSNNNPALSINNGEAYNAVLIPDVGYEIESVIIEMGLSDITSSVYSDGNISIDSVTGNIVITAIAVQSSASGQLPQDSLVAYFDFRNTTPEINAQQGFTKFNANQGNGCLFAWSASAFTSSDDYGVKKMVRALMFDKDGGTNQSELGTSFSMLFKGYNLVNGSFVSNDHAVPLNIAAFGSKPKYNTSSSQVQVGAVEVVDKQETGYIDVYFVVDSSSFKLYINGELVKTYNGTDYGDFVSWYSKVTTMVFGDSNYQTALALYEKALSEVEIVEALEFFKTLEVSE